MCLAVDLIRGLSVIVAEMTGAELKSRFTILACRQHSQHRKIRPLHVRPGHPDLGAGEGG